MKFNKTLLASATTAALAAAGTAQATSFGEVWANDQQNGRLHIWSQSNLNDPTAKNKPRVVDLINGPSNKIGGDFNHHKGANHIIGFSNNAGLDPASRAVLTYLDGWVEIYNSNGGTGRPTKVAELEASTLNAYNQEGKVAAAGKGTTHACGGNPQNDQIQCASIFNADFALFEADFAGDTYTRIGIYKTGELELSPALKGGLKSKVRKAYKALVDNDGDGQPNNICSQYSTDGNLLYLAVQNNVIDGGVIVVDVSNPSNPTILDAFNDTMAAGCGLVNDPDGEHLWITHGFNKHGDPEEVTIWKYSNAGIASGPIDRMSLPNDDSQHTYGGDAHGMQFAGTGSDYLWQVMRVDDTIHVLSNDKSDKANSELVRTFSLERPGRANVQPDVIDRSAFGTRMYWTTRGVSPNTAISQYYFSDRNGHSGVDTYSTLFGKYGSYVKTSVMPSGTPEWLCPASTGTTGYEVSCLEGTAGAVESDSTDPHGLKSLNYLSGF